MGLTLNIIEHELEALGQVERFGAQNPAFTDVRLYLEGRVVNSGTLYLCRTADEVRVVQGAGGYALLVCAGEEEYAQSEAALTVVGNVPPLVVFDVLLDVFQKYEAWQHRMERICNTGGSLQDLLDASEAFLRNNVVVLDPALKLIAYTKSVPCDDPITMELIAHGYHTEENIRKFKLHKRFKPWAESSGFVVNDTREICKYVTIVKSFTARSSFSLIAVMMCNVEEPTPCLFDIFDMFSASIGFFAARDYPDGKPSGNAVDTFLNDLIAGDLDDESAIVERCQYVGVPYEATFCVFYAKSEENSVPLTRLLADVSFAVAPAKTILVDDAVVVLCFNCSAATCDTLCLERSCMRKGKTIAMRLGDLMARFGLSCGRSAKFSRLSGVSIAYEQARIAYELGMRGVLADVAVKSSASADAWGRVFPFEKCHLDYLMGQLTERQRLIACSTYADAVLSAIAEQDAEANTDNYEFLYSYLAHERRTSVVAEALHMHRNSVNYRVSRIQEQFNLDLDDPKLRFDLIVAYRLRGASFVQNAQPHFFN